MRALIERLRYLRSREALAALALPAVIAWKWAEAAAPVAWAIRLAALALLAYILLQGTLYWHLKLRAVTGQRALPDHFYRLLRCFKWSNLLAMGAILLAVPGYASTPADVQWTLGLLLGALLEQINYYHYQLMYDTRTSLQHLWRNGKLRKAALAIDLRRARRVG